MALNKPPSDALLARAAELRAAGSSWEVVAAKLHRSAGTVRKWPGLYQDRWRTALHEAERRLLGEAGAESVLVLRQLLRSDDDKVRRDSAKFLVYLRLEQAKLDQKAAAETPAPQFTSDAARLVAFLEGHTDDELARFVADRRPPGGVPRGTDPPPDVGPD